MKLPAFESIEEKRDEQGELYSSVYSCPSTFKICKHDILSAYKAGFNAAIEIRDAQWAAKVEKLIEALEFYSLSRNLVPLSVRGVYPSISNDANAALAEFYNSSSNDKLSRKDDDL